MVLSYRISLCNSSHIKKATRLSDHQADIESSALRAADRLEATLVLVCDPPGVADGNSRNLLSPLVPRRG